MRGKDATCPGCGHRSRAPVVGRRGGYRLLRCGSCDLVFAGPMSVPDGFYRHYEEDTNIWRWEFGAFLDRRLCAGGRLLDVACGDGTFLLRAREAGYEVTGLDASEHRIPRAQARGLPRIVCGTAERFAGTWAGRFDVVTCFHTLEHAADPSAFLAVLCRFARPGGLIVLGVPNAQRFVARLRHEAWDYPPHHLTRWTPRSMQVFLQRQGLVVREVANETLRIENLGVARNVLHACATNAFHVGFTHRQQMKSLGKGEVEIRGGAAVGVRVAGWISPLRVAVNRVLEAVLARPVLALARGREVQGLGLLALAEKPGRRPPSRWPPEAA